ncbi:sulfate ABC transporter ATP-binding protein [Acinetobacter sp. YIM 103518]|uniref:Sulfate ABC transporter ATP-binding protein n=1 Tax=Acinetobacter faecalis TaxID=2665161 RepID=A0A6L6GGY1_9GAMM|nr:TOBE-like domain-containing protein [Acinetobacter faecalis]MDY6462518.1 TOBE-like domain-containing protein [Acinetobacter faecalis]MTD12053.1 sulfate ABC transporter ATP-binding protein [Acinetobacter faecalis]
MSIQVKNIEKHFGAFHALNNISLDFLDGQLVALLGPSGCGKTTLLRIIAGLESADGGQVILEGEDATNVHVREREVGFVFQHYALFRHMTVFDNIAFGLRVRPRATRPSEAEIKKRVTRLLDLVQLGFLADRYPAQLSGGQRQRIALARALAVEPRVLLLDEPFGALDAKVRKELRRWLRTLHDELHITSIFVTHDQEEALEVADQIIVMNKGNVEQIGSPREVYEKPATPFVFDFLGQANRFEGHNQNGVIQIGEDRIQLDSLNKAPEGSVIAFARPDELRIHAQLQDNAIQATFIREVWIAGKVIAELNDRQGNLIEITLTPDEAKLHQFRPNQTVWLSATALHLFENQVA